jgi:hypothetical protein
MSNKLTALASIALLLASVSSAPAFALDNNPMGTTITKADLEKDGYKCVVVGVGFWECTKGGKTYWCDTGSCQPKPRVQVNSGKRPHVNLGGSTLLSR